MTRGAVRVVFMPSITDTAPARPAVDEVVTYEDVAKWLRRDVREAIEATAPCPRGGQHDWQHRSIDVQDLAQRVPRVIDHWQCACGVVIGRDPAQL